MAGGPPSIAWRSRLQSVGAGHSLTWRTIRIQRKGRRLRRGNLDGDKKMKKERPVGAAKWRLGRSQSPEVETI